MSPATGLILLNQVIPILAATIPRIARPVGAEDVEELKQDAIAYAAALLDSAERRAKVIPPNSVAYYAIRAILAGRRSTTASCSDVMAPGCQLQNRSAMVSMDEELGDIDDDSETCATMHSLLASPGESADVQAARKVDWDQILERLDERRRHVLCETAAGYGPNHIAETCNVSAPRVIQLRDDIADAVRQSWGGDPVADSSSGTRWQRHVRVATERRACRAARNRQ